MMAAPLNSSLHQNQDDGGHLDFDDVTTYAKWIEKKLDSTKRNIKVDIANLYLSDRWELGKSSPRIPASNVLSSPRPPSGWKKIETKMRK